VILPRVAQEGVFVQARADGRMFFILPWGDYSLVGTTEGPVEGSLEALGATADEVGYLLEEANRVLPGRHIREEDVVATFAGARPLLAFSGSATSASREHRLEIDGSGLLSVMGGKYTTYRVMAKQAVDLLVAQHRWAVDRCLTDQVSLLETPHAVALERWRDLTQTVDPDLLTRLLTRYGTGTFQVLELVARDPTLVQPVCPHHEYILAELVHGFRQEFACTITDILVRRTRIAWSSCQGLDLLSTLTGLCQRYAGISRDVTAQQVEQYQQFLARSLAFHPVLHAERQWAGDRR